MFPISRIDIGIPYFIEVHFIQFCFLGKIYNTVG